MEHLQESVEAALQTLHHGCSPAYLLLILRTTFYKDTNGRLLISFYLLVSQYFPVSFLYV